MTLKRPTRPSKLHCEPLAGAFLLLVVPSPVPSKYYSGFASLCTPAYEVQSVSAMGSSSCEPVGTKACCGAREC